jgi:succinate dehydrogenase / fumarate reductase, cytochrome b subunit
VAPAEHRVAEQSAAAIDEGRKRRARWLREVWASTIGKKVIVAITGAFLVLYVVLHMLGNLKAFQGPGGGDPAVDKYAEWLRTVGGPAFPRSSILWIIRAVLILALVLHVAAIIGLARRNRAARPAGHQVATRIQRSLSARTMQITGFALLAFIVFHVLQFTTGTIDVTPIRDQAVYANLYDAFQKWYFVAIYVIAVALLGLHLRHAIWSITLTGGWEKPNRNPTFRGTATAVATVVAVGFAALPIAFYAGWMPKPSPNEVAAAPAATAAR